MLTHTLVPLADYACHTGEGPLYHSDEDAIYWTDIPAGRIFRLDRETGEHHAIEIGRQVGGMTLQADGALLLFCDRGTVLRRAVDGAISTIVAELPGETTTRFNDVFADLQGRVFCGTMPTKERKGRLYRLDRNGEIHKILDDIGCSNGMGFTPDRRHLYYTDTSARTIYKFAYDEATGEISDRTVFAVSENGGGYPDGLTVDSRGNIWSARWDGAALVRYNPGGVETARIPFPVKKVSSAIFGGPNYDTLYVTTAGGHQKDTDGPLAGALFELKIEGVAGVPDFLSRIGL